jgi:RHS repeat-associated protein
MNPGGAGGANGLYPAIFSEQLCYTYGFTNRLYNGNIAGIRWAAAGDAQPRAYGYAYDGAGRLLKAEFSQQQGGSGSNNWGTTAGIDYSVSGIKYDNNGNLRNINQRGWGIGGSAIIDSLRYHFPTGSNKLISVTDLVNDAGSRLGDFTYDPATKTATDYSYDVNGNLIADRNKRITAIEYNHLNLPQLITVVAAGNAAGGGTGGSGIVNGGAGGSITYLYDALGNKLRKTVQEAGRPNVVTDYIGTAMYQNDTLLQMGHAEGRIRYAKQYSMAGDSAYHWQWDYFYKDHLGNVRSVVTEQKDTMLYAATFETGSLAKENALFNNINTTKTFIIRGEAAWGSYMEGYPDDPTTTPNQYTSVLDGVTKKLGASITLKVMAGDKVNLGVKYWYKGMGYELPDVPPTPENVLNNLLQTLGTGAAGLSGGKATPQQLNSSNSPVLPGITAFLTGQDNAAADNGTARAYLNWLLLDEQFNYVPGSSGYLRVGVPDMAAMQTLAMSGLPMSKNGYLFVYLSYNPDRSVGDNGSEYTNLFFDNLVVQHYTGPLVEETQYYPFGLIQQGISSRAFGRIENKIKYNSIELERGLGLNVYDAQFRELDPQIGRWWQIDPKTDEMLMWSTYASNYDNPIRFADPLGDKPDCCKGLVDFVVGVGQGLKAGVVGLKDFVVRDAWQGQTWKNIGNLALGATLGQGSPAGADMMLLQVDEKLGTNTFGAVAAASGGIRQAGTTLLHGTAKERGNITGQILFAVVGTKGMNAGVSALKNAARGARAAEAAGVIAEGVLNVEQRSLQHMFSRHAKDFGVTGNWNKAMASKFEGVLRTHVKGLTPIQGTYRGTQKALHYYNSNSGLNVMTDVNGNLLGGWKLSAEQTKYLLTTGAIK